MRIYADSSWIDLLVWQIILKFQKGTNYAVLNEKVHTISIKI